MKLVVKDLDWSEPPSIRIEKALCPICGKNTGPSSDCYKIDLEKESHGSPSEEERFMIKTIEINAEMVPVMSPQCFFRVNNDFFAFFNYPLSHPLIEELGSINGVEKIIIKSPYKIRFTVADQFNDSKIIQELKKKYMHFIIDVSQKNNAIGMEAKQIED